MRIAPNLQRRGLGQQILDQLEVSARHLGYRVIEVDTLRCLVGARAFYEKNGYVHYDTSDFQGEPQLLFRKSLE
jgi:GNAT superfamily N-acetyltransferase